MAVTCSRARHKAKVCTYGDRHASPTVLLFGDSHAASWLPALDALGKSEHWRILNLTKSACPIPTVKVAVRGKVAPDCAKWRTNALAKIKSIHPDLVIGTSIDHVYTIPGKAGAAFQPAWQKGMTKTLDALRTRADKVILLGDSPMWQQEAPACLRAHPSNIGEMRHQAVAGRVPGQDRQRPHGCRGCQRRVRGHHAHHVCRGPVSGRRGQISAIAR